MTTEEILDCRSPRIVIGGLVIAVAAGILLGLAAGKAIWKKPDCDHPVIPVWVAYVPKDDWVEVRSNVRRIIQELYDTPRATEVIGTNWRGTAITLTNSP